jgi:hypothetical protein
MAVLNWHGHAHCMNPECGWCWDSAGTTESIDVDKHANSHARKGNHGVSSSLHRMDYCKQLGCSAERDVEDVPLAQ